MCVISPANKQYRFGIGIINAKVLCKPRFQYPHFEMPTFQIPRFEMGHFETGQFKSARIGPYSKFQKHIHNGPAP